MLNIGIHGYDIIAAEDKSAVIEVHVRVKKPKRRCPCCGGDRPHSKGRIVRQARHLDCFGKATVLVVHARRNKCTVCGTIFPDVIPGIRPYRRSTEKLRDQIYEDHQDGICGRRLAQRNEISPATVERIYHERTQRRASERLQKHCPRILGIDEHTVHKGYRFATTFCNLGRNKVFDIVEGKSQKALEGFLSRLKGRHKVKIICIDLSSSYRQIIQRWFPNAVIVADRFHAVRLGIHHFMQLAREVVKELPWNRPYLRLLRKHNKNLSEKEKDQLKELFKAQPVLEGIYRQKEKLCWLLNHKTQKAKQCRKLIQQFASFLDELRHSQIPRMIKLANTLQDWSEPIARMWRFSKNNGITEGFHRKMKLIQRRAYGFKNFNNYRLRVIAQCS